MQRYSQYPILGTSIGDQMPSRPASNSVGWSPFVVQTFMHSPHFTHRLRNSFSSSDPGGRMRPAFLEFALVSGVMRRNGTTAIPLSADVMTLLLPRSMAADAFLLLKPKLTAFCGQ